MGGHFSVIVSFLLGLVVVTSVEELLDKMMHC